MTQQAMEKRPKAPLFGGFGQSSLVNENARLRLLCAKAEEVAARHALMLREADHRIKNSLQVVASLMNLQASREPNESARDALRVAAGRVRSIAQIHDALQASNGDDSVDLGRVLSIMCASLQEMAGDPKSVTVLVDAKSIQAPVEIAQPIVLAVNELVINALRHAFCDGREGLIHVSVTRTDDGLQILVADDGEGLPEGHGEGSGYGMKLVQMLTAQVGGVLESHNNAGARFTMSVPWPAAAAAALVNGASR